MNAAAKATDHVLRIEVRARDAARLREAPGRDVAAEQAARAAAPPLSADDFDALASLCASPGSQAYGVKRAERIQAWVLHYAPTEVREAWEKRGQR